MFIARLARFFLSRGTGPSLQLLDPKKTLIVEYEFGSVDAQRVWDIIASL